MKILIVDDENEITDFLATHLRSEAFLVDIAKDGEEGSSLGRINAYDLILLDVMLPKKNGLEVLKEIRMQGKAVPILMLSVRSETEMKIECLNAGADDYLVKPSSYFELVARIKALLRRPIAIKDEISELVVDNVIIDTKKHVVKRNNKEIYLTQKEFALLVYLMENSGSVVSRSMILDHVWDMNADPFSNTIESHILNLRKKIDIDGERKLIHTIPKIGYKIG
ncbi:MAG: response regulator transcription factor [Patescibacteria group bacterium]